MWALLQGVVLCLVTHCVMKLSVMQIFHFSDKNHHLSWKLETQEIDAVRKSIFSNNVYVASNALEQLPARV